MSGPFFIETLAHNGEVRSRQRVAALPVRIGRGYDNDVILDDPHIAASHAQIELLDNGTLVLRDLGSHNGIVYRNTRKSAMPVDGNTVFRLGQTNLRLRSSDFVVAPEVADTTSYQWEGLPPAMAGALLMVLLTALKLWMSDTLKFDAIRYLMVVSYALGGGVVWAGLWSFANRLFEGHSRMGRHLFIAGCGLLALQTWGFFSTVVAYAFSLESLNLYGAHVAIAIVLGVISFHLLTIKPRHPRRFAALWAFMVVTASALTLMNSYQRSGHLSDQLYMYHLLPPALRMSGNQSVQQFINDAAKLKAAVDAQRAKSVEAGEQEEE